VKKLVLLSLLVVYLNATTELFQLLKLPVLFEHFTEHKALNSSITFLDFLAIHYAGCDKPDADHERDMQLPFKSHDGCSHGNIIAFIPNFSGFILKPNLGETKQLTLKEDMFVSSEPIASIWQPPKFC
jgi:hypothetical protein